MAEPVRLNDLTDVAAWIHEHDGRIDAWWEHQFKLNELLSERLGALDLRLTAVERRIAWIVGFSATLGSAIGAGATLLLQKLLA